MSEHKVDFTKTVVDWVAGVTTAGALMQLLPSVAALLSGVWTAMRIWEMVTGKTFSQSMLAKWMRGDKNV